jgi:dihydroorotate dehydrogenase (NAD+) catalytic subunit
MNNNKPDLSLTIAGVNFKNPVIAASGTFGYGSEYASIIDLKKLGGICTKGLTLMPREGNRGLRLHETPAGLMNSIGLENPGLEVFLEKELPRLRLLGPAVIANLSGSSIEEYTEGARLLDASGVDMIELNISCPNVKAGGMSFGLEPEAVLSVAEPVRKVLSHKPLMVKLSPNAPDLIAVARACINAGADALSLVNTFKALAIDIHTRKPVFDNVVAGLSGPAIRPIALRMVWELREVFPSAAIVGMGGISASVDALEFLLAGATAIQVGSATFVHPATMIEIIGGIEEYMVKHGCHSIGELPIR